MNDKDKDLKKEYMDSIMAKLAYTANMLEREKVVKVSLDGIYDKKSLATKEDIKLLNEKLLVIKGEFIGTEVKPIIMEEAPVKIGSVCPREVIEYCAKIALEMEKANEDNNKDN